MSRKEKIKAKIDLFKTLIVTTLTALFGVLSYAVLNYQSFDMIISVSIAVGVLILMFGLVFLAKSFSKELDNLEKEE